MDRQFLREPLVGINIHNSLRKRPRRLLKRYSVADLKVGTTIFSFFVGPQAPNCRRW